MADGPDMSMFQGGPQPNGGGPDMSMFGNAPAQGGGPDMSMFGQQAQGPAPQSRLSNIGRGLHGAYSEAVTNGLMMQPVRMAMEHFDFGHYNEKMRQLYPHASDEEIQQRVHDLYNQAVTGARQSATQEVNNNPYPGHQIGNTIAAVAGSADPSWFIAPGASLEKGAFEGGIKAAAPKVAKFVGQNAWKMAKVGAASDAAAQLLDMHEGQQTDFDVTRDLKAAGMSGLFGAAHAGVSAGLAHPGVQGAVADAPIPDFVKNLFVQRGVDTTPQDTPAGRVSALTGSEMQFTPEEQAQFKQVLKTGSVDDIKNFFAGKNGPKPSWAQVNQLVRMRDAGREGMPLPERSRTNQAQRDNFTQAMDEHFKDQHAQVISDTVDALTRDWKNKPDVNVIHSLDDIQDPKVKAQALKDGVTPDNTAGFVSKVDGKTYLMAGQMISPEHVTATLYHEALGHHGLEQQFGAGLDKVLTSLLNRNVGQFSKKVDAWQEKNPGAYNGNRVRAAEEVLAEASEKGPMPKSWGDAVMSHVRRFGRQMGLKLQYSDAEVRHILAQSHDAVINGKSGATANGFKGAKPGPHDTANWLNLSGDESQTRHMFVGPKAENYDPEAMTAHTPSDGVTRNEISDRDAKANIPESGTHKLGDILDHEQLYENYPHLKDMPVEVAPLEHEHGAYDSDEKKIYLDPNGGKTALLHEVQHAIQDHEQFPSFKEADARVSSGNMTADEAWNHPVEQEARETQAREGMSTMERAGEEPNRFMTAQQLNRSIANGEYQVKQAEAAYEATVKDYVPTRRSNEEVIADARRAGWSTNQIKNMSDMPDLAKRVFQTQAAAKVFDSKISDLQEKIANNEYTPKDLDDLRQHILDYKYVLTKLRNDRAGIARALNMSKAGYTRGQMQSLGELLKGAGGPESMLGDDDTLLKLAKSLKSLTGKDNPDGTNSLINAIDKPHWEEYVGTVHHAMMLSGLSTHVKAPLDMMIGIGRELLESAGSLTFSAGREALRSVGVDVKQGTHPAEVAARLWSIVRAAMDAQTYARTADAFINGGPNAQGFQARARIPVVSKVMDLISAQDAFFRAFATNMHLYGLATRDAVEAARNAGGKVNFEDVLTEGVNNAQTPHPDLLERAKAAADQTLLLSRNKVTGPLDYMKRRGAAPDANFMERAGAFITNFLTPFVRVEANSLWNRVVRRSPLAFLDPQTRADLKAGGAAADTAMSRITLGTASIAAYWLMAGQDKGKMTGDPYDGQKKAIMEATGWRPNAVHENGQYNTGNKLGMSLDPFDVHNQTATMIKDMRDGWEKGAGEAGTAHGIKLAMYSMFKDMADMSYLHDIAPSINALFAPNTSREGKLDQLAADQVTTMEPNLFGQAARVGDQGQPMTTVEGNLGETVKNSLMANIPGMREQLPKRIDPMGGEVQSGASFGGQHTWMPQDNHLTGGNHVNETTDTAKAEIGRLQRGTKLNVIPTVSRTISIDGEQRKLTNVEMSNFQREVGKQLIASVHDYMNSPDWAQMSDEEKVDWIRDEAKDIKGSVKEDMFGGD